MNNKHKNKIHTKPIWFGHTCNECSYATPDTSKKENLSIIDNSPTLVSCPHIEGGAKNPIKWKACKFFNPKI